MVIKSKPGVSCPPKDCSLVPTNGLTTLPDLDMGTNSDSDSKPDGYIKLRRTCSHCTDSGTDPYSLFLHRTEILVRVWQCV